MARPEVLPPADDLVEVLLTFKPTEYAEMGAHLATVRQKLGLGPSASNTEVIREGLRMLAAKERPFYTVASLAQSWRLGERTVRNWVESGQLPSYKLGRARRIDPEDADRFLAARRQKGGR